MGRMMTDDEKLKAYTGMVEVTRKWVTVMDTKATFVSALNTAMLVFIWTGAKLTDACGMAKGLAIASTCLSLFSLLSALFVILPRETLARIFGNGSRYTDDFKAISYYGYVADHYPKGQEQRFVSDVEAMSSKLLAREALEQHFTNSHVVQQKSTWVTRAGYLLIMAIVLACFALFVKAMS